MLEFVNTVEVLGDDTLTDSIVDRTVAEYKDNLCAEIGAYAFQGCTKLTNVDVPAAKKIGAFAFATCYALEIVNVPEVVSIGSNSFDGSNVRRINFEKLTSSIPSKAFYACGNLSALVIRNTEGVVPLGSSDVLQHSGISRGTGYIYVPKALIDSYKVATNWSTYADQFRALEDYTVDGTTTGELDETKIAA